jgi:hypothetical protein
MPQTPITVRIGTRFCKHFLNASGQLASSGRGQALPVAYPQCLETRHEELACKKLTHLPTKPQRPSAFKGSALLTHPQKRQHS